MEEFKVRCVGYTQSHEKYFTIGKEYEVCDGRIIDDKLFKYGKDPCMTKIATRVLGGFQAGIVLKSSTMT